MFPNPQNSLKREIELYKNGQMEDSLEGLSPEELASIEKRLKSLDILLDRGLVAKYKLEIHFGKNRTSRGAAFSGVMQYWKSGTQLHGGGDERVWECPKCESIIDADSVGTEIRRENGNPVEVDVRYCGKCGSSWKAVEVVEFRFFKLTEQDWAHAILKGFQRLDLDADIMLKYHRSDIRVATSLELAKSQGGEALAKAVANRGLHVYPLRNIVVDTRNGADLYGQIRKFINA